MNIYRQNGFTLIELLAVIVILAIIALIATPIILGIIKEAKEESSIRSAENYIVAVEQALVRKNLEGEYNPTECTIVDKVVTCDGKYLKIEVDGEVPTDGTIIINNGSVSKGTILQFKDNNIVMNEYKKLEIIPAPVSFEDDSWTTIAANVKVGNLSKYNVGDTKEVKLEGYTNTSNEEGTYTIRIANTSTEECTGSVTSETACGFVVEFEDIIIEHAMNDTQTNIGGYPASSMYKFLNDTTDDTITSIYESLPEDVRSVIKETKVISSHGSKNGETNFESTDKLYLLSTKEVWGNNPRYDTAKTETRQLDYYRYVAKVTTSNYEGAKKQYNAKDCSWRLRSASSDTTIGFYLVVSSGNWGYNDPHYAYGVAPAFRIG